MTYMDSLRHDADAREQEQRKLARFIAEEVVKLMAEPHPVLGSGALREALEFLTRRCNQCACMGSDGWHEYSEYRKRVVEPLLSLSSPIEPAPDWRRKPLRCTCEAGLGGKHSPACMMSKSLLAPREITIQEFAAELYQICGALNAPTPVLDQLSAAASGKPLPYTTLLPFPIPQASSEIREALENLIKMHDERRLVSVAEANLRVDKAREALAPSRQGAAKRIEG